MCGIVAMLSNESSVAAEPIERALDALRHRGPDGRGVWVAPHRQAGLGHARLAIIDLQTGRQPLTNEEQNVFCVVNGEFYGYEQIQRDLVARGHTLRTKSDSEILLHLYEEKGAACLEDLRGEFAFVLWDERNRTLFAGRDRFGIKPLYYTRHEGTLYLASEAKGLFAAGVPARWDIESFFQAFQLYLSPDRSYFHNVLQIPPGHYLLATPEKSRLVRYWDLSFPRTTEPAPERTDSEWIERLTTTFDEAVRVRLRSDVPVAFCLSGGIDSSAIAGTAAKFLRDPFDVFTICFTEDRSYDEGLIAEETAARLGARFNPLRVTDLTLAEAFSDAVFHSEIIPANENGVSKFLLARLIREKGIRVVLTGEGGDELFAGYAHFRRDLLRNLALPEAERNRLVAELDGQNTASRGTLLPTGDSLPMDGLRSALGTVPSFLEALGGLGLRAQRFFDPQQLERLTGRDPVETYLSSFDVHDQLAGRAPLDQARYLFSKTYLHNYILVWNGDRAEMAHSVEGRTPLLDHHLAELVRQMPHRLLINGTIEKHVFREATRPVVTDTVYRARKHPFTAPPGGLRPGGRMYGMVQDVLRGPALHSVPLFDPAKVRAFLDELPNLEASDRQAWSFVLLRLAGACHLAQRFRL